MGLIDLIETRLLTLLEPVLKPIRPLIKIFTVLRDNTIGIFDAGSDLLKEIESEYDQIRHFSARPEWKNRVISVPAVIQHVEDLTQIPSQVVAAFKDLIQNLRQKVDTTAFETDELEGIEDLRGIIRRLGARFAAVLERILGILTLVVDSLVTIRSTIDDLKTIVDAVRTVRENLEHLDGLFLTQKNPRKLLRTQDGEAFRIRVGSLHT